MKQKTLLLLLFAMLTTISSQASIKYDPQPYDFAAYIDYKSGSIRFRILSEKDKTVAVAGLAYETNYNGKDNDVVLPEKVSYMDTEYTVTTIGYKAFYLDNFNSFSMPNTVTVIENEAFRGTNMNSLKLSTGLRYIGDNAFTGVQPTFGKSNASISVFVPASVEYIGKNAFGGSAFFSVDLSRTKQTALNSTFSGAYGLQSVSLPSTLEVIGDYAFRSCSKLTNINYNGAKITTIGREAFRNCEALTSFTIPEGIREIGAQAFVNCTSLTSITLPASFEKFSANDFTSDYNHDGKITPLAEIKPSAENPNFKLQDGMLLNSIGTKLLWVSPDTETLTVPEGVTSIELSAASCCTKLKKVSLPTTLNYIGDNVFYGCTSLESIDIPFSVKRMGSPFYYCTSLKEINIPYNSMLTTINISYVNGYSPSGELTSCKNFVYPEGARNVNFNDFFSKTENVYILNPFVNVNEFYPNNLNPDATVYCYEPLATRIKNATNNHKWEGKIEVMEPCPYYVNRDEAYVSGSYSERTFYNATATRVTFNLYHGKWGSWNEDHTQYSQQLTPWPEGVDHRLIGVRFNGNIVPGSDQLEDNVARCIIDGLEPGTNYEAEIVYETGGKQLTWPLSFRTSEAIQRIGYTKSTQTSVSFNPRSNMEGITECGIIYNGQMLPVGEDGYVTISGLQPQSKIYTTGYYAKTAGKIYYPYADENYGTYIMGSTLDVIYNLKAVNLGSTSVRLVGITRPGDATITAKSITLKKETAANSNAWVKVDSWQGDSVVVTGLTPGTRYQATFNVTTSDGGEKVHQMTYVAVLPALEMTMQQPKVGKNGITVFTATTNLTEDEKHAGFEWIKYDAPEAVAPKEGYGIVYGGTIAGQVTDLSKTYYKVRAFCELADGNRVYSDWLTFDADEFSTFQPIVFTSADIQQTEKDVTIRGFVTSGSEDIIERGFEYWIDGASSEVKKVELSGQQLETTLNQLQPSTTYVFRVYVTTASGTFYGEEHRFTTPATTAVAGITVNQEPNIEGYYDLRGRRLSQPLAKGMTIIVYSNGTTRKLMKQ